MEQEVIKMAESLMVTGIVSAVVFFAGKSLYKTLSGKDSGCGCNGNCAKKGSSNCG